MRTCLAIDWLTTKFFKLSGLLCVVLVVITTEQVVARYFFQASSVAIQELEWHLFGLIFLFAGAHTYRVQGHVKVDILCRYFSPSFQKWVNRVGIILFLGPFSLILAIYGFEFAMQARTFVTSQGQSDFLSWLLAGESSPDPGGLKARWLIRLSIPISALLMLLQGVSEFIKSFLSEELSDRISSH